MLCLKEDCFDFVLEGTNFKIFKNSDEKYLAIVYDDEEVDSLKKEIRKINKKFVVYVFSFDTFVRDDEFEDIFDLVDLKPVPIAILNVYKRIFGL